MGDERRVAITPVIGVDIPEDLREPERLGHLADSLVGRPVRRAHDRHRLPGRPVDLAERPAELGAYLTLGPEPEVGVIPGVVSNGVPLGALLPDDALPAVDVLTDQEERDPRTMVRGEHGEKPERVR